MKPVLILLALQLFLVQARAQHHTVNGYLLDSITHLPIAGGKLTNTNTRQDVQSDDNGFFRIQAAPNDVLYALAPSYHYDTLTYSLLFTDTIKIYLAPSGDILPTVTVTAQYNKYQLDSISRKKEFDENRGTTLPTVSSNNNSAFGIGINLDRFSKKKYKNQKSAEKLFNQLEENAYVNYRFSPTLVAYYTSLKGDALKDFMQRYTPSYQWLRQHNSNEEVLFYINDKLKEYKAVRSQL